MSYSKVRAFNRRERRKAKQSGWRRLPKANPKKVGHGPNGLKGVGMGTIAKPRGMPLHRGARRDTLSRLGPLAGLFSFEDRTNQRRQAVA